MSLQTDVDSRRQALYSANRNQHANQIKNTLLQSSVLREGEYNFNILKEKDGVWSTWTKSDYRSPKPLIVAQDKPSANDVGHLKTHFEFGKHGEELSNSLYQTSRTQEDYDTKNLQRPHVHVLNRTINWPDMAPQYAVERGTGATEYHNAFLGAALPPSTPAYPRINTSRLTTPSNDNSDVKFNSKVNVQLGSDLQTYDSETQCSYISPGGDGQNTGDLMSHVNHATDISSNMRKMARQSNVFRTGDYNNLKQEPGSVFTLDYGKKLSTPSTFKIEAKRKAKTDAIKEEDEEEYNEKPQVPKMIDRFLKEDHGVVLKEALEGKQDHTSAHFILGSDADKPRSLYAKDFGKDSRIQSAVRFHPAPPGSQVLQFDPEQSTCQSTIQGTHAQGTFALASALNADQQKLMQLNMHRRYGTNVVLSCDNEKHQEDRQNSLSHSSYLAPPSEFKAMRPRTTPMPAYNYIVTDTALPFSVNKQKQSEAQNQYRGYSMDPASSSSRQMSGREQNMARRDWGWDTHFINGYEPKRYFTENRDLFSGKAKDIISPPPAGKSEEIVESKFTHFNISENTQDMKPMPNRTDLMDGIRNKQQAMGRSLPTLPVHRASLMSNDYQPLHNRIYTPAQMLMMRQSNLLNNKTIEQSHFFHKDSPSSKNFQTTTMADFVKPELMMTPRALTSVR